MVLDQKSLPGWIDGSKVERLYVQGSDKKHFDLMV